MRNISKVNHKLQVSSYWINDPSFPLCIYRYMYIFSYSMYNNCLLYTSDAADDMQCVDLGGRRIIKKSE